MDALGTHTQMAEQMIEQEGDAALALTDHQGHLSEDVKATVALTEKDGCADHQWESDRPVEKDHGRLDIHEEWTPGDPEIVASLDMEGRRKGLRGIGGVRAERRMAEHTTKETRSFVLSFSSVNTFATAARSHWGIENSLHWVEAWSCG